MSDIKETVFGLLLLREVALCSGDIIGFERESAERWYRGGIAALRSVVEQCSLEEEYIEWRNRYGSRYGWKPEYEQKLKELVG